VRARLGESRSIPATGLGAYSQDDGGVSAYFFDRTDRTAPSARGDVLIGADGINSRVREILYPTRAGARNGIMLWRGAHRLAGLPDRTLDDRGRRDGGQIAWSTRSPRGRGPTGG